jgi:hypothetical protein
MDNTVLAPQISFSSTTVLLLENYREWPLVRQQGFASERHESAFFPYNKLLRGEQPDIQAIDEYFIRGDAQISLGREKG